MGQPQYPLWIEHPTGNRVRCPDENFLCWTLENFDSDRDAFVRVWDSGGRAVRVKIARCDVEELFLYEDLPGHYMDAAWATNESRRLRRSCFLALIACSLIAVIWYVLSTR